jgi:FKBP-type peptidyl-prolyl cis-trans isomerase SlyD
VPRRALKGVGNLSVGMQLHTQSQHGVRAVTVTHIAGDMVTIDGNHPLAGQNLNFEVEIAEVRTATEEELAHGHVHGPGGHHDH